MFNIKRIAIFIFAVLLVIIIQLRDSDTQKPYKGILGDVLNPCVRLVNNIFSSISNTWDYYVYLVGVEEQNRAYKAQLDNLTLEYTLLQERFNQTKRLQQLLRFNDAYDFESITSNVIGANEGYRRSIVIDSGTKDGVKTNDPVIGFRGLVGRVSHAHYSTSDVDILLNLSSNVSVTNSRTRAVGILKGDSMGRLFIEYYDRLDDVRIGDKFITSGLGQLFPKGIPIGDVSEVIKPDTGLFQEVFIKEQEDFYKLENVFVIKNFTE